MARLPEPRSGQSPVDVAQLADDMEGDVRKLEELDKAIEKMTKMLDESLILKREAFQRHYRIYLNVARIQEGYLPPGGPRRARRSHPGVRAVVALGAVRVRRAVGRFAGR